MNRKLSLVALALSILAVLACAIALGINYMSNQTHNNWLLLILLGVSVGLLASNYSYYKRSHQKEK